MTTIRFNKPFQVITQFSSEGEKETLSTFITLKEVYPAGRLDYDSEGLLLLTDNGPLQHRIADPKHKLPKTYWAQLEGEIDDAAITALQRGVTLKDGKTRPARCQRIDEPATLWPRQPPIRERKNIPTSWIELTISEGKNRQVRRMTAAVGYPTLRLIRYAIGPITLDGLAPGSWQEVDEQGF
jgi:23S rRNA pseudouridine2457 synthase